MVKKKHNQTPEYQWEQALIDAYYDFCWREVLEPLYQKFLQWKASELEHHEISEAIHLTRKETQQVYSFLMTKRPLMVRYIQLNEEWFSAWLTKNPAPPSYQLVCNN